MVWLAIAALVASTVLDIISTRAALAAGAVEVGPLMRLFGRRWLPARIAVGAIFAAVAWAWPDSAGVMFAVAGVWTAAALWNWRNARVMRGEKKP
jgi:hypothetical protein